MMGRTLVVLFFTLLTRKDVIIEAACTLPDNFTDTWISADKGELVITGLQITDYPVAVPGAGSFDFNCIENSGTSYFFQAVQEQNIFGTITRFFLCLDIQPISDDVYKYFIGTEYNAILQDKIYAKTTDVPPMTEGCNRKTPYEAETYIMLVRKGSVEDEKAEIECPTDIQAKFSNVTITDGGTTESCAGSSLDVCTNKTQMAYTYEAGCTTKKTFSSEGVVKCLHYITSGGATFLSVWNMDTTPTFQFSCYAFVKTGGMVYATETPKFCTNTTTHLAPGTQGSTTGKTLLLTSITETCLSTTTTATDTDDSGGIYINTDGFYALLAIPGYIIISLIILLAIILYKKHGCICKKKKQTLKKRPETPEIYIHPESSNMKLSFGMRGELYKKQNSVSLPLFRPKRKNLKILPMYEPNWHPGTTLPCLFPLPRVEPRVKPIYKSSTPPILEENEDETEEDVTPPETSQNSRPQSAVSLYSFDNFDSMDLLGR